jgi:ATP-dependent DNA ligase
MSLCRWLRPTLVASIEFLEWTLENRLRHPKFVALRDDREAKKVIREGLSDSPIGTVTQFSK